MGRACSTYGGRRGVYRILVGKPEGKRSFVKPRRRREYNIKMDLHELGHTEPVTGSLYLSPQRTLHCTTEFQRRCRRIWVISVTFFFSYRVTQKEFNSSKSSLLSNYISYKHLVCTKLWINF